MHLQSQLQLHPEQVTVLKLAEALNVDIYPNDIKISHKLHRKGIKPIIVKFQSHKGKARMYKERTKLKHIRVRPLSRFNNCNSCRIRTNLLKRKPNFLWAGYPETGESNALRWFVDIRLVNGRENIH